MMHFHEVAETAAYILLDPMELCQETGVENKPENCHGRVDPAEALETSNSVFYSCRIVSRIKKDGDYSRLL